MSLQPNISVNMPQPPAAPQRILFTYDGAAEIINLLKASGLTAEMRYNPNPKLTDWQWADAWVGIHLPQSAGSAEDTCLSWYHLITDGYNHAAKDLTPRALKGALITHTVGDMPVYIGTWTAGYVLGFLRFHDEYKVQQAKAEWKQLPLRLPKDYPVLVIGTGAIGQGVAYTLNALGFQVEGANTSGHPPVPYAGQATQPFAKVHNFNHLTQAMEQAKIVVAALPLTPKTQGLLDEKFFSQGRAQLFINVGRGPTVDPVAFKKAVDQGWVAKAVLDVVETEPLPADDWRWSDSRITITPHISGNIVPNDSVQAITRIYQALHNQVPWENIPLKIDVSKGY